jgi:hypothetical protein
LCLVEKQEDHHFFALLGVTQTLSKELLSLFICVMILHLVGRQEDHHFFAPLGGHLNTFFFFFQLNLFGLAMESGDVCVDYETMSMDDLKNFLHTSNI